MSQNFPNPPGPPHGSPQNRANAGFEGLMSSLISPGPTTPVQGAFSMPWLGMQDWRNGTQSGFGLGMQNQMGARNQSSYDQNNEEDYEPAYQTPSELRADGVNTVDTGHDSTKSHEYERGGLSLRTLQNKGSDPSSTSHTFHSQAELPSTMTSTAPSAPNAAENAKKLTELRAKLLAKKSKDSREASPAAKPRDPPGSAQSNLNATPRVMNGTRTPQAKSAMSISTGSGQGTTEEENITPSHVTSGGVINTELDNLFAEVRNGTDDVKTKAAPAKQIDPAAAVTVPEKSVNGANPSHMTKDNQRPQAAKRVSSADLSDGEIRSEEEQPVAAIKSSTNTKPSVPRKEGHESQEKSRRESEVEAAYQPPSASQRDSQEKLRRQSQVQLTYSPLRRPSTSMSKPPLDTISAARFSSSNTLKSPKSAVETPSRPWITQPKGRIGDYDSYVPPYRDARKSSMNEPTTSLGKRTSAGERVVDAEDRRRAVEENARAAAAYKKTLDIRPQPSRVISTTETTYLGKSLENRDAPAPAQSAAEQQPSAPISPTKKTSNNDPDILDWLELTEYYDEEYRKGRLSRFRKKKELDKQRMELEQEEQLEQQQRSLFRASVLPSEATPHKVANMAPPSLPLREANGSAGSMKTTALAAASLEPQVGTPTLKRQHAEDDTDTHRMQPMDKVARVDSTTTITRTTNPALKSLKDEQTSPTFPPPIPLEHRISRDDGHLARSYRRNNSRSPDRTYRRRSASPERRRFSGGFVPTCHNCGQPGHYQNTCPEPRRDGRETSRTVAAAPTGGGGGYQRGGGVGGVSANYRGRNPLRGFQDPRSRYGSAGRSFEDDKRP